MEGDSGLWGTPHQFSCHVFSPAKKLLSWSLKGKCWPRLLTNWGYWAKSAAPYLSSNLCLKWLNSLVLLTWRVRHLYWVKIVYLKAMPFVWSCNVLIFIFVVDPDTTPLNCTNEQCLLDQLPNQLCPAAFTQRENKFTLSHHLLSPPNTSLPLTASSLWLHCKKHESLEALPTT